MVRIKWLAHASFLIEGDGLRIITDPYEPNEIINLPPITEPADLVIRSSSDDEAHCFIDTIPTGFELVTATEIVDSGATAHGVEIQAIWAQESIYKEDIVRDNAMYRFELGGLKFSHLGDVGNPLSTEQMKALADTDILFALTGGHPTIALDDLKNAIEVIKPKIVIPMHYRIPGPRFPMLPIDAFTSLYPSEAVEWVDNNSIEVRPDSLPDSTKIMVLQPTLFKLESTN